MRLSLKDYITILKYYNIDYSLMNAKTIKQEAEDILAKKLCRCIKKVDKTNSLDGESKAIAVCKNSVFTHKNLKLTKFKCKRTPKLFPNKSGNKLLKTMKKIKLGTAKNRKQR